VVVMAVRKAVSAATITFTATSMILPFFIVAFFDFVEIAHARHSSNSFGSALAYSRFSLFTIH
jgi:hypothetical protein